MPERRKTPKPSSGSCEICGGPIRYVPPSVRVKGIGRYCSFACMGIAKRLPGSQRADSAAELWCKRCERMRPVDDFYPARTSRGRRYDCKPCTTEIRAENARQAPEDPVSIRRRKLKESYGITMEDYDALYAEQDGCCAICGTVKEAWAPGAGREGRNRFLVVDHRHADGLIRGLLCGHCNRGLGQFRDDPEVMLAAITYLSVCPSSSSAFSAAGPK